MARETVERDIRHRSNDIKCSHQSETYVEKRTIPMSDSISVNTACVTDRSTYNATSNPCSHEIEHEAKVSKQRAEKARHDELEERFNKGWEMWVSKMGGEDGEGSSYNFEAEELAVRLGTRVDKAGKLHAKILLQKIYHFWHCKQHTDMVLIAGSAREEVHLHMFLAHTEFYEKVVMIPESEKMWKEGKLVLDMTGLVVPKSLKSIVGYVYTGALKITLDNVTDIAMAAKAMGLRRLQQQCTEFLDYIFADFHLFTILRNVPCDHKFFDVAWTKILKRFRRVCSDRQFLQMDAEQLELLIASDKLDVESEYQVFKPALEWMNHDRCRREQYFFKLMAQVRFAYMDLEELIACMQDEDIFRTNPDAQKILEDADMYATMESMGDQWKNYPPWPPRNETIRDKVEQRKRKLARLRPKARDEICNEDLPCCLEGDYGCTSDPNCQDGSKQEAQSKEKKPVSKPYSVLSERAEMELFGLTEAPESYQNNQMNRKVLMEGKETSTNRIQLLAQLRLAAQKPTPAPMPCPAPDLSGGTDSSRVTARPSRQLAVLRDTRRFSNVPVRGPSEISLPSCMMNNRRP